MHIQVQYCPMFNSSHEHHEVISLLTIVWYLVNLQLNIKTMCSWITELIKDTQQCITFYPEKSIILYGKFSFSGCLLSPVLMWLLARTYGLVSQMFTYVARCLILITCPDLIGLSYVVRASDGLWVVARYYVPLDTGSWAVDNFNPWVIY